MTNVQIFLLLPAIAEAVQVSFISIGGRIYIETGRELCAMCGQVKDKDGGIRIISFIGDWQLPLTEKSEVDVSKGHMIKYEGLGKIILKVPEKIQSPILVTLGRIL